LSRGGSFKLFSSRFITFEKYFKQSLKIDVFDNPIRHVSMESIGSFSRPVFRVDLVPDFLETLRVLCLPDWVSVRERLYTDKADELIQSLKEYANAFVEREASDRKWYTLSKTYPLDKYAEQLYCSTIRTKCHEQHAYQALLRLLKRDPCPFHKEDWNLFLSNPNEK
jgi:hypothetical protein